jgi:hypothetical protein
LIVARCCHHIWPPLRYRMQWWLMWLLLLLLLLLLSLQQQLSLLVCLRASSWNTTWPWYQPEACLRTDSVGTQQLGVAEACLACATRVNRLPRGLAWPPTLAAGLHVRNRLPIRRTHVTLRICLDRRAIPCTFWMPMLTSVDVHICARGLGRRWPIPPADAGEGGGATPSVQRNLIRVIHLSGVHATPRAIRTRGAHMTALPSPPLLASAGWRWRLLALVLLRRPARLPPLRRPFLFSSRTCFAQLSSVQLCSVLHCSRTKRNRSDPPHAVSR